MNKTDLDGNSNNKKMNLKKRKKMGLLDDFQRSKICLQARREVKEIMCNCLDVSNFQLSRALTTIAIPRLPPRQDLHLSDLRNYF